MFHGGQATVELLSSVVGATPEHRAMIGQREQSMERAGEPPRAALKNVQGRDRLWKRLVAGD